MRQNQKIELRPGHPPEESKWFVYVGRDEGGILRYVGITMRGAVRWAEHRADLLSPKAKLFCDFVEGGRNLTKQEARILEQTMINFHKLERLGGTLLNEINSIAPKYWVVNGIPPL